MFISSVMNCKVVTNRYFIMNFRHHDSEVKTFIYFFFCITYRPIRNESGTESRTINQAYLQVDLSVFFPFFFGCLFERFVLLRFVILTRMIAKRLWGEDSGKPYLWFAPPLERFVGRFTYRRSALGARCRDAVRIACQNGTGEATCANHHNNSPFMFAYIHFMPLPTL